MNYNEGMKELKQQERAALVKQTMLVAKILGTAREDGTFGWRIVELAKDERINVSLRTVTRIIRALKYVYGSDLVIEKRASSRGKMIFYSLFQVTISLLPGDVARLGADPAKTVQEIVLNSLYPKTW